VYPFVFHAAPDEQSAHEAMRATPGARLLAGGTTLVDLMKLNVERPPAVIDINALPLAAIDPLPDGGVRVGATVRNSDMAHHPLIQGRYPFLSQALLAGASPQLRNMATTAGNVMQRTRCWYFRDAAMPCNKRRPGSGCSAIDGDNRIHAVLGTSEHCIATHASDMCVPLAALDAIVQVNGPRGRRAIPFTDFHVLPGDHPDVETRLEPGELITSIDIPPLAFATRSIYVKVRDRASYAFALASAAVALDIRDGTIREARIALGGVGTKPWRARAAEETLRGARAGASAFQEAAKAAVDGAVPRTHNAFKIQLARRTLLRALARAEALA
jgi:xanthine dehydrogenase YagS FAD-binding subunit